MRHDLAFDLSPVMNILRQDSGFTWRRPVSRFGLSARLGLIADLVSLTSSPQLAVALS
jgi:hypothetical protein